MNENVEKREAIINPEILPEKLSVIIKDEDGKLYESTKDNLRQKGYKIKELEFKKFINSDTDIQRQIEDIKIIRNIDRCMYIYINDNKYKKGLKKRIINNDINLNDNYKEVVNKILNYTEEYEENELLNITSTKWI